MSGIIERAGGAIVRTVVPGELLLMSRLGQWYEKIESHKYHEGDVLILRRDYWGFGVRPVAVVRGYDADKTWGGTYHVTMYADRVEDPGSNVRVRQPKEGDHFKWNMENLFKKVNKVMSPDEALELYKGKKATWGLQPYSAPR